MKIRTKFEDIASMALLYTNRAIGNKILSYDKVLEFNRIINENLERMDSDIDPFLFYEEESKLYFTTMDETGKTYLVMNPHADLNQAESYHIGCLPLDIVVASQMENALSVLGLTLVDGKFVRKKEQYSDVSLSEIFDNMFGNSRDFYIRLAHFLSKEERESLKASIEGKSCENCSNATCRVENSEKIGSEACSFWDNKELIGRQKVLVRTTKR